jgi:hypothetical protein
VTEFIRDNFKGIQSADLETMEAKVLELLGCNDLSQRYWHRGIRKDPEYLLELMLMDDEDIDGLHPDLERDSGIMSNTEQALQDSIERQREKLCVLDLGEDHQCLRHPSA